MSGFRRESGHYLAVVRRGEAYFYAYLAGVTAAFVRGEVGLDGFGWADLKAIKAKLEPPAILDDPAAAAEFRRLAGPEIAVTRSTALETLGEMWRVGSFAPADGTSPTEHDAADFVPLRLCAKDLTAALQALSTMRVVFGTALGVETDTDSEELYQEIVDLTNSRSGDVRPEEISPREFWGGVFLDLGMIQESLLEAAT